MSGHEGSDKPLIPGLAHAWLSAQGVAKRVLASYFLPGELVSYAFSQQLDDRLIVEIASAQGDAQQFIVWEKGVEGLLTTEGVEANLLSQLEAWFPLSALGWGERRP